MINNREYHKNYYQKHKEKLIRYSRKYHRDNKKKILKKMKKYQQLHKKKIKEYNKIYDRKRYLKNKERILKQTKDYYKTHKEQLKEARKQYRRIHKKEITLTVKKYYKNHRKEIIKWVKNKLKTDVNYKIIHYLRTRLNSVLKGNPKSETTMKLVGCSIEQLKKHLKSRFKRDMSFSNYGKWHIDHIRPCASFDLAKVSEQKKCFNYTNLQPLWAIDNWQKGKK